MDTERRDIDPTNGGGDGGCEPALSVWRVLLVFLAGAVPIVLLVRGLYLALDLPKDSEIARPAMFIVLLAAVLARSKTFRHMTIVAAVGVTVGAFAMLCFLPVTLYAQNFEIWSQRFMLRLLGMVLIAVSGAWITRLACRRLAVPVWESPAKARS